MVKQEEAGSGKFKMVASKFRLRISQLAHKISTTFQRLYLCFRGRTLKYIYIYYDIVHEAHNKENKVIDLTITQDCKYVQTVYFVQI